MIVFATTILRFEIKPFNRVTEDAWEAKQDFLPEAQQALLNCGVFGSRDRAAFPIVF